MAEVRWHPEDVEHRCMETLIPVGITFSFIIGVHHEPTTTLLIKKFDSDDVWRLPPELGVESGVAGCADQI